MADKARKSAREVGSVKSGVDMRGPLEVGMIHKDDPVGQPMYPPYSTPTDPQGLLPKNRLSGSKIKHD